MLTSFTVYYCFSLPFPKRSLIWLQIQLSFVLVPNSIFFTWIRFPTNFFLIWHHSIPNSSIVLHWLKLFCWYWFSNIDRFNVSLVCGPQPDKADIAFQLNPRFDVEWVVRNSKVKKQWGTEEATATTAFPFHDLEPFQLEIFVSPSSYLVGIICIHLNV